MSLRFKDLEEGKKYIAFKANGSRVQTIEYGEPRPCAYTIMDGLLFSDADKHFSRLTFDEVQQFTFEPYVEYHTFEEAIAHMRNGGKCGHKDEILRLENCGRDELDAIQYFDGDVWEDSRFMMTYFEPKWVLFGKDD